MIRRSGLSISLVAVASLLAVGVATTGGQASEPSSTPTPEPSSTPNHLTPKQVMSVKTAVGMAQFHGTPDLRKVQVADTDRGSANAMLTTGIDPKQVRQLVTVTVIGGQFTAGYSRVPWKGEPITGTVLTVITDRETGNVTDWSLTEEAPEMSQLETAAVEFDATALATDALTEERD